MHKPCAMRSAAKLARSGARASSAVGSASTTRLAAIPRRRSIRRLKNATASPATAMPSVLALTARAHCRRRDAVGLRERGQDGLRREQIDQRQERCQPDEEVAHAQLTSYGLLFSSVAG